MKTTAVKRADKRLHIENKAEDSIVSPCKFLCPVSCKLREGQTRFRNYIEELENIQENKKHHQGVSEASFGHKKPCTLATRIAEMMLEASSLYHAKTTQQQGTRKQAHLQYNHYYRKQHVSNCSSAQPDCTVAANLGEAFLTLFLSLIVLRDADSPAQPALPLH